MLTAEVTRIPIPAYDRGPDDPFPPVSFGGQIPRTRPVYPYHRQDDIDIATMPCDRHRMHRCVRLSNGLLEATILPDMNGRVHSLRDLRSGREIFYRNRVIKPALVALRGAWLSGGIEFNFPTLGHSVSTVSPVFCRLDQTASEAAVIIGDLDRSTRELWQVRLSLKPGRAALDVVTTLLNPNLYRERLYYWENAAVPAADDLRFVCRCDWVVGKEATPFPFQDGIDRSWHRNNSRPGDHFGYRSHADFFGAFYGDRRVGTYHVAPRHAAPGQKYFTWGTETDSRIWEQYLTDTDGQYVEIQSGILETQWVTGWLQPGQTVAAAGSWFGVEDAGELTWATSRVAVAVEAGESGAARLNVVSIDLAGPHTLRIHAEAGEFCRVIDCRPGVTHSLEAALPAGAVVEIRNRSGELFLRERWSPGAREAGAAAPEPKPRQWVMLARNTPELRQAEEAERYHNWRRMEDLLDRDGVEATPDSELPRALLALKTHHPESALKCAHAGLERDPGNAELHMVAAAAALRLLRLSPNGDYAESARDHALAARLDGRFAAAALRVLAETALLRDHILVGRDALEACAKRNPDNPEVCMLLAGAWRRTGVPARAREVLAGGDVRIWPGAAGEAWFLDREPPLDFGLPGDREAPRAARHRAELLLEFLLIYWRVGWLHDLASLLAAAVEVWPQVSEHPVLKLLQADLAEHMGDPDGALRLTREAAAASPLFVAPARWEDAELIRRGITRLNSESFGCLPYLLGLFLAEHNDVDPAVAFLQQARSSAEPAPMRRLANRVLADWAVHVKGEVPEGTELLREAYLDGPPDRRILLDLDTLLHGSHDTARRQGLFREIPREWRDRGDVRHRLARLDFDLGRPAEAVAVLRSSQFSVYEGFAGVRRLYVDALLVQAANHLAEGEGAGAIRCCEAILEFPKNLGAASYLGEHARLARFFLGLAEERAGRTSKAEVWWRRVLTASGVTTTYTVGDVDAAKGLREDEALALELAALNLRSPQPAPAAPAEPTALLLPPDWSGEEDAVRALSAAIRAGTPGTEELAAQGLARYPCSAVLRILHGLTRILRPSEVLLPS